MATTSKMIYRRFGKTEIQMPVYTCGGMRFQHAWQDQPLSEIPQANQINLDATIHRAFELGINHFETASSYGTSESQIGCVLPDLPRNKIIVQTKITPKQGDVKVFLKTFDESLARLGLDHVDLLAIHGINNDETLKQTIQAGGCFDAAKDLVRQGKVKHVGFSTHGPLNVILKTLCHEKDGGFDFINLHWYYIQQDYWPAILKAKKRDMGVMIISPSDKGGKLYAPPRKLVALCQPLHPVVFNGLFCLSHPQVHSLTIGAARPTDFDLHLEALPLLEKAKEVLAPIEAQLDEALVEALGENFAHNWQQGLPQWEQTPGQINMHLILNYYRLAKAFDMVAFGKYRYGMLNTGGHWIPGNDAKKVDEYDLSEALRDSPFRDRIPDMLHHTHQMLKGQPSAPLTMTSDS